VGVYNRERFISLGGFDAALKSTYWQLMDFGFRAHLWGEEIRSTQKIRLSYNGEAPSEDSTAEESYRRFYLKNLAPRFQIDGETTSGRRSGRAWIPLHRFFAYLFRSGGDPFSAWAEFSGGRRWVKENSGRFRRDARSLTDFWENPATDTVPESFPGGSGGGMSAKEPGCGSLSGGGPHEAGRVECPEKTHLEGDEKSFLSLNRTFSKAAEPLPFRRIGDAP
jgi:hypothetical protein